MHVLGMPEILDDLSMLVKRVTMHGHRETNTKGGGGGLKERFARGQILVQILSCVLLRLLAISAVLLKCAESILEHKSMC